MKIHPDITEARVVAAVESQMFDLENPGFCISCGAEADDCEPDARRYKCESCGERDVYGAHEILINGWFNHA